MTTRDNQLEKYTPPVFLLETATKESFLDPLPYEYLYGIEDPFEKEAELVRVGERARELGIKNFKTLYNKYIKSVQAHTHQASANGSGVTAFEGQPIELSCGNWLCNDSGVWIADPFPRLVCSHPIMPTERYKNIDSGLEKINIAFRRGGRWQSTIVDKEVIASTQQITQLYAMGVSVTSHNARDVIQFLQDMEALNYDILPEVRSTTRLGWVDEDVFLPYDENVVFDGEASFGHMFEATKPKGAFEDWREMMLEVRRMNVTCRIALAASFASALLQKVRAISMFVHFWSPEAATGKTVLAMIGASVWGNPEMGQYTQSFNSTEVGAEMMCSFFNNMPLVMDELQVAKDRYGNQRFNVYKITQGVGRARGKRTGGLQKTTTWRLCCITTGETQLANQSDGAGAFARIIDVEMPGIVFNLEIGQKIVNTISRNYALAGQKFVERLIEIGEDELQARYSEIARSLNDDDDIQEKQRMAAAALLLADEIADEVIFHDEQGRLTAHELKKYLMTTEETSTSRRAYEFIQGWVSLNMFRFQDNPDRESYGMIEGDWVYIIKTQFDEAIQKEGYNSRSVLSAWNKRGLIQTETRSGGKLYHTVRRRVEGGRPQFVALKLHGDEDEAGEQQEFLEPSKSIYEEL